MRLEMVNQVISEGNEYNRGTCVGTTLLIKSKYKIMATLQQSSSEKLVVFIYGDCKSECLDLDLEPYSSFFNSVYEFTETDFHDGINLMELVFLQN